MEMDEQTNKIQKIITDKCYGKKERKASRGLSQTKHVTLTGGALSGLVVKGQLNQQLQRPGELVRNADIHTPPDLLHQELLGDAQ